MSQLLICKRSGSNGRTIPDLNPVWCTAHRNMQQLYMLTKEIPIKDKALKIKKKKYGFNKPK